MSDEQLAGVWDLLVDKKENGFNVRVWASPDGARFKLTRYRSTLYLTDDRVNPTKADIHDERHDITRQEAAKLWFESTVSVPDKLKGAIVVTYV
jgi:hypothetical protein